MKLTDLHRNQGLKIASKIKPFGVATSPGNAGPAVDRREQRRLDQAAGLVPFACKLNVDLLKQVQALAEARGTSLNDTVAELLAKGLAKG
jgi:hypothetical protein